MFAAPLPVTIRPPFGERAKAATARSISPASRMLTGLTSTLSDGGTMRGSGGQRLLAVADLNDFESGVVKKVTDDLPIVLLVLDHQNAFGHAFPTCCSTSTGTSRKNVEPQPGSDSTQIRPPCMATIRRAIDRPSPVPPFFLVMVSSAC